MTSPDRFRPALEKALAHHGPSLIAIDVPTDLGSQTLEVHSSSEAVITVIPLRA